MKNLTTLLLFTTLFGYAQIDYKGLVKNLEEVTINTDIKEYFKGLPFEESYGNIEFNDERFLQFHGIIVDNAKFSKGWGGKTINITPFNEIAEYKKIKAKLIEIYGEPEIDENGIYGGPEIKKISNITSCYWENETQKINIKIDFKDKEEEEESDIPELNSFYKFDIIISFKEQ